jgi:glycosyltransferase involved in cell wall biosynthesis
MAKKKKTTTKTSQIALPKKKIRVLAYCDAPTCATGFATVSRNILSGLYSTGRYDVDILGINYWGDPHNFPFRIWPTGTNSERDPYGRKKVFSMIPRMDYDILFFLQDSFIMDFLPELHSYLRNNGKNFKSVCYFPVDGAPEEQWMKNVDACDYTVAYSEFGKKEAMKVYPGMKEPLVIPHGVNTRDYHVLPEKDVMAFRAQYFGALADKFIFTNLNRNQQRKDIPRTIAAFAELRKHRPDTVLYLHMAKKDQGWDLERVIKNHGLDIRTDVFFPENFGPNQGYPRNIVNMIYNISDCVISTTLGEGWGLSWTEAMSTKTPIIMPDNTALSENITEDLGWLAKSGSNPSLFTVVPNDNEVVRPLVDVEDMVAKMIEVHDNPEEAKRRAENAYVWATTKMEWMSCIVPKWVTVFDKAYEDLQIPEEDQPEIPENKVIEAESF